ncbi:MAG: coniferyl aldehyde dehydrogenase [Vibrio sp.]
MQQQALNPEQMTDEPMSETVQDATPSSVNQTPEQISQTLQSCLTMQKKSAQADGIEPLEVRRKHLENLKRMLIENKDEIIEAINKDYGNRSYHETMIAEVLTVSDDISSTIKHVKKWMKVQHRSVDQTMYFGAKNRVIPQPLGVVGLIIPWNFPLNLSFSGLSAAFAAGNRAMVKLSENSLHFTDVMIKLAPDYFPKEKLQFFKETGGVGIEFSKLQFDHLMFTGSGETGRKVMASAAKNLTPVTLELGGKSPAVIDPEFSLSKAVERLMFVKQFNAGQICTCVDYVFVHQDQLDKFISAVQTWTKKHCPDIHSKDYTSIIDDKSFQRLQDTLEDASAKGANIIQLQPQDADPSSRKMPLYLVLDTTPEMIITQRETFGPLLMVKTYKNPEDVAEYVNAHDTPLAFYPFSNNKDLVNFYLDNIMSGGVSVNDALFHVGQHNLPFGGVGPSGMGHYHGYEGFLTFSKLRPVFYQAKISSMKFLAPPYGKTANKILGFMMKLKG